MIFFLNVLLCIKMTVKCIVVFHENIDEIEINQEEIGRRIFDATPTFIGAIPELSVYAVMSSCVEYAEKNTHSFPFECTSIPYGPVVLIRSDVDGSAQDITVNEYQRFLLV